MKNVLPAEIIENKIYVFRGSKVMLDRDLAKLYGVETKVLLQSVKRNKDRFPEDFSFQLTQQEFTNLRSQIVTSSWGGQRYQPFVFTEHGVAMLSSVLKSKKAIAVNIQIIRTFIQLRNLALDHSDLHRKIEVLEKQYDEKFKIIFDALHRMITDDVKKEPIGFKAKK